MKRSEIKTRRKPLARGQPLKRGAKPMQRGAKLKARKTPRAFRQRRDPQYARWIRTQRCLLSRWTEVRPLIQPWPSGGGYDATRHGCLGNVQSCHVTSRGAGGDDRGNLVPLCALAHEEQHRIGRTSFERRWGLNLTAEAERLDAAYQRETGAP